MENKQAYSDHPVISIHIQYPTTPVQLSINNIRNT